MTMDHEEVPIRLTLASIGVILVALWNLVYAILFGIVLILAVPIVTARPKLIEHKFFLVLEKPFFKME